MRIGRGKARHIWSRGGDLLVIYFRVESTWDSLETVEAMAMLL
jgi:hypothetical protein